MKKGVLVLSSVLAIAAIYIAYTQASLDVYKVKVETMHTGTIKISLDLTGEVRPQNESDILTQNATVSDVFVKEGDTVAAGDPLFSYDTAETQKQLDSAKMELETLQARQSQTQSAYQTTDSSLSQYAQNAVSLAQSSGYELYHYNNEITNTMAKAVSDRLLASVDGSIQSIIQSYLPQIKEALSSGVLQDPDTGGLDLESVDKNATLGDQIQTAETNVSTLESKIESMQVMSAIGGKVLEVDVKKGEAVAANAKAMVIADTGHMEVHTMVSGKDIKSLKTGMDALLISADGTDQYSGVITRIGQMIVSSDTEGGENMTDLIITPKAKLDELPGSSIDLEIILSQKKNVPVVSLECLTADGSVFVVDGNAAHKRTIEKGMQDDYNIQVTGGLKEGEKLIVNPDKNLKDGQRVEIGD